MTSNSRYIRARVVDFSGPEFAGEIAGPKGNGKDKKIRVKLRRARALKRRISNLSDKHPIGWKVQLRTAKNRLATVMSSLRALGWKSSKPRRARKPGEDDMDAVLDDIPEAEPGETEEADEELDVLPDGPEAETEGENWLDAYVGVEPRLVVAPQVRQRGKPLLPVGKLLKDAAQKAATLARGGWRPFDHLGASARIQTRSGQSAMITTVNPGLFIVQIVSDEAAHKLAGDNVGILPLLLYPLVKNQIQKLVAPKHPGAQGHPGQPGQATPAPVAQPAAQPAPVIDAAGCDCKDRR